VCEVGARLVEGLGRAAHFRRSHEACDLDLPPRAVRTASETSKTRPSASQPSRNTTLSYIGLLCAALAGFVASGSSMAILTSRSRAPPPGL
jgi:hypothetical protein